MDKETIMKIPHVDIMAKATGMSHDDIWQALIYFVLYGKPSKNETNQYCLYFCYKTIEKMIMGAEMINSGTSDGWADTESIVAEVLGWTTAEVETQARADKYGTLQSLLVHQVWDTVTLFLEWHAEKLHKIFFGFDDDIQPSTWVWYHELEKPVYLYKITRERAALQYTPSSIRYHIMIPKEATLTEFHTVNSETGYGYFNREIVTRDQISKLIPQENSI